MNDDNYPFNRPHWLISVNYPVSQIAEKATLLASVQQLAEFLRGRLARISEPPAELMGTPGYETFGITFAFEWRATNAHVFLHQAIQLPDAIVEFDPGDVKAPVGSGAS